jgi:EAL domain-containing protein (putative c-di-GMP-specific phosphodiesterase class I)/DNA-binding response OmpR family regulator
MPQQAEERDGSIGGGRILVVDDDDGVRGYLAAVLDDAGYETVQAASGSAALALIDDTIAAVVLDNRLPDLTGMDLVIDLRAQPSYATLPVLLVTGDDELKTQIAGLDAGATDFLVKPIEPEQLVARLGAHLRGQRAWAAQAERQLARRSSIVSTLFAVRPDSSAEATAHAVCNALRRDHALSSIAIARLDECGRLSVLASRGDVEFRSALHALANAPAPYLLERAEQPWIELPRSGESISLPVAIAPIRLGGLTVGMVVIGALDESGACPVGRPLDELLAEAIDIAGAATGLLGLSLHQQAERDRRRQDLATVVRRHAFEPAFQPMVGLQRRNVIGFEALTRFDDGVPPDQRFAEAARLGVGLQLELATMSVALEMAANLPDSSFVSLNVTPRFVMEQHDALRSLVRNAGRDIVLELTEHDVVEDYPALRRAIHSVDSGVRVSIDDAGAGFASLRHVVMLAPDFVKLDRTWISGIDSDPTRQAMVAGLCHFANQTGCDLVAEGIEEEAERQALCELDVPFGQGFLLGRPGPAPVVVS